MPAFTSPDNIQYPVAGDVMNPLQTKFASLATSVQAALTSLRAAAVQPELPAPKSEKGNDVQAVTATSWADLPNSPDIQFNASAPMWVEISLGAWMVANGGTTRCSVRVSGATTLTETQIEVGGDNAVWGQVLYADNTTGTRQCSSTKIIRLNAGLNTIAVRAYQTGAGTNQVNYSSLQVAPLRWA
jgi:hypothetical protein